MQEFVDKRKKNSYDCKYFIDIVSSNYDNVYDCSQSIIQDNSKTCLKLSLKKKEQKLVFKPDYCLMQVKSIAECSKGSILQYF